MKKPENPCYGCDARIAGCHAFCERYDEFYKVNAEYRKHIQEEKSKALSPYGRTYTASERRRKKTGGQR